MWDTTAELAAYVRKRDAVAATCRLTEQDELALLGMCRNKPMELLNRQALLLHRSHAQREPNAR